MIYFCYFLIGLLGVRLLVAIVNYISFSYLPKVVSIASTPSISILIPARNEEENIGTLLEQLSTLNYGVLEIIVCNDHSEDNTVSIVKQWATRNPSIKLIHGQQLPKGWLGKNYACHQLSQVATGDILLYLDADVSVKSDLLERSISHFQKHELHLLSIFPKQVMLSFGEKISVPLMNWILLSLLPLSLIRKSKMEAFSAANGQFMMFNSVTYKAIWPHEKCKSHQVEDIAIMRWFKKNNLAVDTRLGDNDISCRMYVALDDAIEGFTKNIFQFFGNSVVTTIAFGIITTAAPFILYFYMGLEWVIAYLLGIVSIRIFVSLASQQSVLQNVLFALPQHLVFLGIIIKGLINNQRKKLLWKGRNILQDY
ncbi:glycosyltransferase family 2 protein [Aurantibacter crassamenti]|uniref:glycosyltransferase n=1 Tax=Aurantibacter crassamenti TaxID=1837375 RepID=UPI001939BFE2|nr:glycosyltransferase family A protein [Aurantibacter crassamenti]MBM1107028.1 glycosyltransferase family 2 protein [Aurantibacter crassamenti]